MSGGSVGRVLEERFELLDQLGVGGMGTVWRARDLVLHRDVAVKEVRPVDGADPDETRERVLREARALARVSHPNVVTVHHIVDERPHPWLVMELVEGSNLQDRLRTGPLPEQEVARIGRQVVAGLQAIHAVGILHRDIKPANVLLRADGRAVLADFGIASVEGTTSITQIGQVVGSPEFMAPERLSGLPEGPAADLWSLGMTLFVAVEGHSPMRRKTTAATMSAVLSERIPPPERAVALRPALEALLIKEPTSRADASEAAHLLSVPIDSATATTEAGAGVPPAAHTPPVPMTVPRRLRSSPLRRRGAAVAGALAGALVLAGGMYAGLHLGSTDDRADGAGSTSSVATASSSRAPRTESSAPPSAVVAPPASPPSSAPPAKTSGVWIAQLASEPVSAGTAARDRRLRDVRRTVPGARVLRSDQYAALRSGYWVVYAPGPFATGRAALKFCAGHGRVTASQCVGRYLSDKAADRVYICYPRASAKSRCTRS
ncbi:serine/threonine-protein kinase [Luteipulveratus mongoliensis]|uniref:non-specific serine/threonine protein kinase n=1 Tax=Luteipulveratus mongoliensis TaxID=571913 RepID=A0A0K1JJG2_9MICO|nr:serine/threonine-protein kinase [Luteipulveratus mongoliensis]AKU16846.1 hypothetical protein VV02_14830 [Luteipulveratus mongoliensis]